MASLSNFDPNIKRMYNIETVLSVQHEIVPGVSVTGGWYHRDFHNLWRRDNTGVGFSDFTPFTVFSPIDGTPITYYNVSAAKVSQITRISWTPTRRTAPTSTTASSTTSASGCRIASRCSVAA